MFILYIYILYLRLQTARCYNEMFADTPLSSVIAPGAEKKVNLSSAPADPDPVAPSAPSSSLLPPTKWVENVASFGEESAFVNDRRQLDPDEGSRIDKETPSIHEKEPEGLKASMKMSLYASTESNEKTKNTVGYRTGNKGSHMDPPSTNSKAIYERKLSSGGESIDPFDDELKPRNSADPPSKKSLTKMNESFPEDEAVKSDGNYTQDNEFKDHVNVVIVDDDEDSFTGDVTENKLTIAEDEENEDKDEKGDHVEKKETVLEKIVDDVAKVMSGIDHGVEKVMKDIDCIAKKDIDKDEKQKEDEGDVSFPAEASVNGDIIVTETNSDIESKENDEFLNISHDGDIVVLKATPERPERKSLSAPLSTPSSMAEFSYYDIHKKAFKETNSKLDEQKDLVKYVADWERIVTSRVQSKYLEYSKQRKELNHYAKKVEGLLAEEERLKERGKPMKPKSVEKLQRNEDKLKGARETHDNSGESLLMLMDEVTLRAWRDAFPLLKKSVVFESDFADINHRHMAKLGQTLELINAIGREEKVDLEGRLDSLETKSPEDIHTGTKMKNPMQPE